MYCSNCGARASGNFCSECGQKLIKGDGDKFADSSAKSDAPIFGFDFSAINKSLADAMTMQKEYEKSGEMSEEMIKNLRSGFGMDDIIKDINAASQRQTAEIKEQKAKLKKARADISKGLCPDCGATFKKRQTSCSKCGASTILEAYEEH